MVNSRGKLEEDDLLGSQFGDSHSEFELTPGQRERNKVLSRTGLLTTSEEEGNSEEENPNQDEPGSPQGLSGHHSAQGDRYETGPLPVVPLGTIPGPNIGQGQAGDTLYSQTGVSLVETIKNPRKRDATRDAFSGPPKKKCDPTHIWLRETGWGMAQRVFDPSCVWQTREANAFST